MAAVAASSNAQSAFAMAGRPDLSPSADTLASQASSASSSQLHQRNGRTAAPLPKVNTPTSAQDEMPPTSPHAAHAHHADAPLDEDELPEPICGGCKGLIDEDSADAGVIHFATRLWHVDCFRCAKCRNPVTTDRDDILLLSDGHPICGQCNYSCQICGLPIMEEAIMTGDESYHASCFVCRSCHTPIAELVFAKTSQGIYCMKCHNQRVARSRRHAEKKRQAAAAAAASGTGVGADPRQKPKAIETPESIGASQNESAWQQHKLQDGKDEAFAPSQSPRNGPLQPIQAPLSPKRQNTSRRPLNPPPPTSLRSLREHAVRPSIDASAGDQNGRPAPSSSHSNGLAQWPSESPLLAGVHAAAQRNAAAQPIKTLASPSSSEDISPLPSGTEHARKAHVRQKSSGRQEASEADNEHSSSGSLSTTLAGSSRDLTSLTPRPLAKHDTKDSSVRAPSSSESSRLGVHTAKQANSRTSRSFSFYDPDIVSIMDSFGRLPSSEDLSSDGAASARDTPSARSPAVSSDSQRKTSEDILPSRRAMEESSRPALEDMQAPGPSGGAVSSSTDAEAEDEVPDTVIPRSGSVASRMRQSLQSAKSDGKIKLDRAMLEALLTEFDGTHSRMKTLQTKYDKIRRASQQAALGFSSARQEYEQEVRARYDAEAELLSVKREVHLQASQLAELTSEKRQHEHMHRQTHEIKSSIQDLEKELSKLRLERDLHAAEAAALITARDDHASEDSVKRSLTSRLDDIKEKFSGDISDLLVERDVLRHEVESLVQRRDASAAEVKVLTARSESLNAMLAHVQQRLEHSQAAEKLLDARLAQNAGIAPGSNRSPASAFGFKGKPGSIAASSATAFDNPSQTHLLDGTQESISYAAPVPVAKVEAAPKKFKWMKGTKMIAGDAAKAMLHNGVAALTTPPVVPPKGNGLPPPGVVSRDGHVHPRDNGHARHNGASHHIDRRQNSSEGFNGHDGSAAASHSEIVVKEHLFQPFNIIRPVRCFACQKNMWGQSEMRCQFCNQACHYKCLHSLPTSCNQPYTRSDEAAMEPVGPSMFGRRLVEQVRSEDRKVPLIVQRCVETVEMQGMDYEGIYRKSGGTSQLKIITQLFEKGQPFELGDQERFNDVSAITSVLKNYFRELPEPLMTFELHERFIECAENKALDYDSKHSKMRELVHSLPAEHFDTLKFLVIHLGRIATNAEENRMGSRNLGVVFGPTLMRSSDPSQEFAHMGGKAMAIEFIVDNPDVFD